VSRIVYGIHPVLEILNAHPEKIEKIVYNQESGRRQKMRPQGINEILTISRRHRIRSFPEKKEQLLKLAGDVNHQGVVAVVADFRYSSLEELICRWKDSGERAFFLILDSIQDPHNLGAIVRSAEGAGVHGIIVPKDRAVGVTSTVEKVSAGAVAHIGIARVTNISRTVEELQSAGIWVAGTQGGKEHSLYDTALNMDIAIVIGSEGKGIRPLVKKKCDYLMSIPMKGKIGSLNASVSAAVVIYEALRQRLVSMQHFT